MPLDFDYAAARQAGYSDDDILTGLQKHGKLDFDLDAARKAGYSSTDIMNSLTSQAEPKPADSSSNFVRGAKEAFQQVPQLGYGLVAGAGAALESAVGEGGIATGIKKAGVKGYQEWGDKIAADSKQSDSFSYSYDKAKEGDFGAMVDWLAHGIGYAGGQGVQMLATAGVGSIVGKAGLKAAAEKIASGMVAKESARLIAEEGVGLTGDALAKMATANVAAKIGQTSAIGAMALGQEGGEIFGDLSEKSVKEGRSLSGAELAKAFGATLAAGGLEFVGDKVGLDVMLGKSALLKPAEGMAGLRGRLARGAIAGAAEAPIEGATEYGQTLLEEYGKGNDPFGDDALKQAKDAAALGAIGGASMGGLGGAIHGAKVDHVTAQETAPEAAPLQLAHNPDPYISFPDGTVGQRKDVEAFIGGLPEDQRIDARARLYGMGSQDIVRPTADDVMAAKNADEAVAIATGAVNSPSDIELQAKNEQIDKAWQSFQADRSAQREQELAVAEQARRDADVPAMRSQLADQAVEQADAITNAQGFDVQEPTAMELAMQQAQARRQLLMTPVSQRQSQGESNATIPAGVAVRNDSTAGAETAAQNDTSSPAGRALAAESAAGGTSTATQIQQSARNDLADTDEPARGATALADHQSASEFDAAAHAAATSPHNDLAQPTQAQKEAGNYTKGHVSVQGMDISIENPRGSTRSGVDPDGKAWSNTMQHHYGYLKGTIGADKDHIDTFIGPNRASDKVFVVDQVNPGTGKFDEHKVMLGFNNEQAARDGYQANYAKDWAGGKNVTETTVGEFKDWMASGNTKKPFGAMSDRSTAAEGERRQDTGERQRVGEMSHDDMRKALLTSDLTGLPNKRAFAEHVQSNPSDHVLYGDLDDFKAMNTKYGHEGADQILRGVGSIKAAIAEQMGVTPYHRSGDEFLATHSKNATLEAYGKAVQDALAGATFKITQPDGTVIERKNVGFSYGTGQNQSVAESKSDEQKAERKRLGLRAGDRGAVPGAEGRGQDHQDHAGGRNGHSDQAAVTQAKAVLNAAKVTGKDRLDLLDRVKAGTLSLDDLAEAYPAEQKDVAPSEAQPEDSQATQSGDLVATKEDRAQRRQDAIDRLGDLPSKQLRTIATGDKRIYMRNAAADILQTREQETSNRRSEVSKKAYAQNKKIDTERDTMAQAIAKLGGVNSESAASRLRLTPEELSVRGHGVLRVFTKTGRTMDEIGATLADLGYVDRDENGKYDQRDFEDKLSEVAGGADVHTPSGIMARAQEQHDRAMEEVGAQSDKDYTEIEKHADAIEDLDTDIPFDQGDARWIAGAANSELTEDQLNEIFPTTAKRKSGSVFEDTRSEDARGRDQGTGAAPKFGLTGETADEVRAAEAAREKAAAEKKASDTSADKTDKAERDAKDIAARQSASADNFQLGQSAEDGLSGQGDLLQSRGSSNSGITTASVTKAITSLRAKWLSFARVNTVQSIADLPADVAERANADGQTEGFYDPQTKTAYLIADNIASPERAVWVAVHEVVGHGGLRMLKDKSINEALNFAGANRFVRDLAQAIRQDRGDVSEQVAIEEAIAELSAAIETDDFKALEDRYGVAVPASAQNGVRGIVARAYEAVRRFIASMMGKPAADVSDADVRGLIGSQREAVEGGDATTQESADDAHSVLQSRAPAATTEHIPKWAENATPEQKDALRKSGAIYTEQTLRQRITELKTGAMKKLQYGILDQFAPINDQLGKIPYIMARMAKNADGTLEALMLYGRPQLDADGGMLVDTTKKGFVETMQALNGEHDRFFSWLAGRRAADLKKQGRENLFTDSDISALATLNRGQMSDGSSREAAYLRAQKDIAELNRSVLDIAEQSGIIDPESRKVWASDFYVPFYRVMEEGITGPSIKSGLVNQKTVKKLKGGTNNLGDLTQNMLMNWSTLLTASAKNRAADAVLTKAASIGAATEADEASIRQMGKSASTKAVSFMDTGRNRWFVVEDEHLLAAISALEFNGYNNNAMKVMSAFKNYLTRAVTSTPLFKVRNLIRDSVSTLAVSDSGFNPVANMKQGYSLLGNKDFKAQMVAGGGVFRFGTLMEGNRGAHVKNLIDAGVKDETILDTKEKMKAFMQKLWDGYQEAGDLSENVNRAALYNKLRAEGKSHLEASFEARDLMDFGLSGAWAGVRALNQILPFFNARLQGLYKLGRGYNDDPKRMGYVVGAVAMASVALMLAYKDDDDWKKRSDADRNNYWWFKVGGTAFRIPKPFEIGALGSAIEHFSALFLDGKNTDSKRFSSQMGDLVSGQLAMNPVPQIFRPIIDVYSNKDSFTGRPIESMAMEKLKPEDRYTYNTSEMARMLGKSGVFVDPVSLVSGTGVKHLSPVQIDSMIRGYFSGLGTLTTATVDSILHHTVLDRGAALPMTIKDFAGSFAETLPSNSSRYVDMLYSTSQSIEQSYGSYQNAIKSGDIEKARTIQKNDGVELAKYHLVEALKRNESKITQQIQRVMNSHDYSGAQKETMIRGLRAVQDRIARQFEFRAQ